MKRSVIVCVLLAVLLVGALLLSAQLKNSYRQALEQYETEYAQLSAQRREVEDRQAELDALLALETEKAAKTAELEAQAQMLEEKKAELTAEIEDLAAALDAVRQESGSEDDDKSYYLEVYDALTEGLDKVKEYLAGD